MTVINGVSAILDIFALLHRIHNLEDLVFVLANMDILVLANMDIPVLANMDILVLANMDILVLANMDILVLANMDILCVLAICNALGKVDIIVLIY